MARRRKPSSSSVISPSVPATTARRRKRVPPRDSTLGRVRIAHPSTSAGVLFYDEGGHLMMVVPSYKDYRDLPGGIVEPGESPRQAAIREVREELGIDPPIGRLLVVDWAPLEG